MKSHNRDVRVDVRQAKQWGKVFALRKKIHPQDVEHGKDLGRCVICGNTANHWIKDRRSSLGLVLDNLLCSIHYYVLYDVKIKRQHPKRRKPKPPVGEYDYKHFRLGRFNEAPYEFFGKKMGCVSHMDVEVPLMSSYARESGYQHYITLFGIARERGASRLTDNPLLSPVRILSITFLFKGQAVHSATVVGEGISMADIISMHKAHVVRPYINLKTIPRCAGRVFDAMAREFLNTIAPAEVIVG